MAESAPMVPGEMLLGKYRVERVLGQGGMGVVVAATHVGLGELFAIKFLLPEALDNPLAVERFLREARAAAKLKGEHVTKVVDVGTLPDGEPYMVMEHLAGDDLRRVTKQSGALPAPVAVDYVLQACEALAEAHAAGIIHRDIKPSNLFLTRRPNGTACIKVLDFGISKQISGEDAELTRTGDLVGSPLYMSPEQLARSRGVDARTDIWSLGMVLYKLLTGKVPFFADSLPEIIARVMHEDTAPPSAMNPELPAGLDVIVARCLKKRPEERYASMQELAADLRAVMQGDLPAPPSSMRAPSAPRLPSSPGSERTPMPPSAPRSAPRSLPPDDHATRAEPAAVRGRSEAPTGSAWGKTGDRPAPSGSSRALRVIGVIAGIIAVAAISAFIALRFAAPQPSRNAPAAPALTETAGVPPQPASPVLTATPSPGPTATAEPTPSSAAPPTTAAAAAPTGRAPTTKAASSAKTGAAPTGKKHEGIY